MLLVVALTVTAGCFAGSGLSSGAEFVDITTDALVGVWQDDQRGGVIEFTADGDFYADDVGYMFVSFTDVLPTGFDVGTWSLERPRWDPRGPLSNVHLIFTSVGSQMHVGSRPMEIFASGSSLVLANYTSDPSVNAQRTYTKRACCAA